MSHSARTEPLVEVIPMPQLAEARNIDDNWTGLKDKTARRRRQFRLNARSYRRRKLQQAMSSKPEVPIETCQSLQFTPAIEQAHMYLNLQGAYLCLHRPPHTSRPRTSASSLLPAAPSFRHISLDGTVTLPLSPDHLIPLVQFNAFRATLTNMLILSVSHLIPHECDISTALQTTPLFIPPVTPPPSLAPTPLQQSVPHDMWIDLLPHGTMRDNAIRTMDTFNHHEICSDMLGGHDQGRNTIEWTGVLVWGNPWEVSGWEVTEGFVNKWGFLLRDCWEIIAATNHWRAKRGDEPLLFEI
ncbi:hypothetical protein N431DRAFT_545292 [Stipitochalara longipes BDJ]|nr:hypothetical protein N431DRAFT_545292 [Stipitochalara longipes BDJ]